jgi:hypothetical protein
MRDVQPQSVCFSTRRRHPRRLRGANQYLIYKRTLQWRAAPFSHRISQVAVSARGHCSSTAPHSTTRQIPAITTSTQPPPPTPHPSKHGEAVPLPQLATVRPKFGGSVLLSGPHTSRCPHSAVAERYPRGQRLRAQRTRPEPAGPDPSLGALVSSPKVRRFMQHTHPHSPLRPFSPAHAAIPFSTGHPFLHPLRVPHILHLLESRLPNLALYVKADM